MPLHDLIALVPDWVIIPGLLILVLGLLQSKKPKWRCAACGHVNVSPPDERRLTAFCAHCGRPRPRGTTTGPVSVVVTAAKATVPGAQTRVEEILAAERFADALPTGTRAAATITGAIPAETPVLDAHQRWSSVGVTNANPLPPYPCQPADARVPPDVVHVAVDAVERPGGGMASFWGFEGIYVSLLVSLRDGRIWDARATDAD